MAGGLRVAEILPTAPTSRCVTNARRNVARQPAPRTSGREAAGLQLQLPAPEPDSQPSLSQLYAPIKRPMKELGDEFERTWDPWLRRAMPANVTAGDHCGARSGYQKRRSVLTCVEKCSADHGAPNRVGFEHNARSPLN